MTSAKDSKQLVKKLKAQGFEIGRTSKGHPRVSKDGRYVATFSLTPSDSRGMKNAIARLKRAGFQP